MVISALWSIFAWTHCGPYIRNPVSKPTNFNGPISSSDRTLIWRPGPCKIEKNIYIFCNKGIELSHEEVLVTWEQILADSFYVSRFS